MSGVIGIDIGADCSTIGCVGKGQVDIVLNEVSDRKTPSLVGFKDKQRLLGEQALSQIKSNSKNTCRNLKLVLGRSPDNPNDLADLQEEEFFQLCKLTKADTGELAFQVQNYNGEPRCFSATEATAMFLTKLKNVAQNYMNAPVRDAVVAVPGYYTVQQRIAMKNAIEIAGINCLKVMNEHTATALAYGIYRSNDFKESEPTIVAFCSAGHSHFSCSIVKFVKGELVILAERSDRSVGGRVMDRCIMEHCAADFQAKYNENPMQNPKSRFKLEEAAARCRKVLSANKDAPITVECLVDDLDLSCVYSREMLEEKTMWMRTRIADVIESAIADAKIEGGKDEISAVEIVGGCSRVPFVQDSIRQAFGKELSKTLNADECVARGCALQAAILSPLFKVRDFSVKDFNRDTIEIGWKAVNSDNDAMNDDNIDADGMKWSTVFEAGSVTNVLKVLKFYRCGPFEVCARYASNASEPFRPLGFYHVQVPEGVLGNVSTDGLKEVKLKAELSHEGILKIETGKVLYEEMVQVEEEKKVEAKEKPNDTAMTDADPPAPVEGENSATDTKKDVEGESEENEAKPKFKKKTRRIDISITSSGVPGVGKEIVDRMRENEFSMIGLDKEIRETDESRNDLETRIYDYREKLDGVWARYTEGVDVDAMKVGLKNAEDWLYDHYDGSTKADYQEKIMELNDLVKPITSQIEEERRQAEEAIRKAEEEKRKAEEAAKAAEEAARKAEEDAKKTEDTKDLEKEPTKEDVFDQQEAQGN